MKTFRVVSLSAAAVTAAALIYAQAPMPTDRWWCCTIGMDLSWGRF